MKCKEKTRLLVVPHEHRQSYREWRNELRTRQMAKALREAGARLDDTADVERVLRAANFTEDCIDRLAADAAQSASVIVRPVVA